MKKVVEVFVKKTRFKFVLLVLTALFLFSSFQCAPPCYSLSYLASYYPSGYTLHGSTTYVSGAIGDLQIDNSILMTFRSYPSSYVTSTSAMLVYGEGTVAT
ncbi:MAG: hypothetical protein WCC63_03345, partial [Candidatus Bathyarchaeia archaeon]